MPLTDDSRPPLQIGAAWSHTLAALAQRNMAQQENGVDFIKRCCKLLSAYGVRELVFEYDGSGDSGDFGSPFAVINRTEAQTTQCLSEAPGISTDVVEAATRPVQKNWDTFIEERRKEKSPLITPTMCGDLVDHVFDLLPLGWEINDGSYGTVVVHIATEQIEVEHNERYTEVRTENFSY